MPRKPKVSEHDADKWRIIKLEAEVTQLREALAFTLSTRNKFLCDNAECTGCPSWHGKLAEARLLAAHSS